MTCCSTLILKISLVSRIYIAQFSDTALSPKMPTIQDIRRANLDNLVREVASELGTNRGAAAELARRTAVPAPFISQFLGRRLHGGYASRL